MEPPGPRRVQAMPSPSQPTGTVSACLTTWWKPKLHSAIT